MRRSILITVGISATVVLAACGSSGGSAKSSSAKSSSASSTSSAGARSGSAGGAGGVAADPGILPQDLTFTGPMPFHSSGRNRGACTLYASAAGGPPSGRGVTQIFIFDGVPKNVTDVGLEYTYYVDGAYHGPGAYAASRDAAGNGLRYIVQGSGPQGGAAATSGTWTVNPDEKSGSVDATFADGEKVTGAWKCEAKT